jgi:hypothetical protein
VFIKITLSPCHPLTLSAWRVTLGRFKSRKTGVEKDDLHR